MKLQQLRYIWEVAHHDLNVSATAQSLFTSQPGISKQIRLLEDELGVEIFARSGKHLTHVTPVGEVIIEVAGDILRKVESIKQVAQEFSNEKQGTLSIATTHTQARYVLPDIIAEFRKRFPKIGLNLHQGTSEQIADMIAANDIDFAIATGSKDLFKELMLVPSYRWDRAIVVPNGHELTKLDRKLTLHDLARYPLVTYVFSFGGQSSLKRAFEDEGLDPEVVFTARDADVIKTYVRMGMGVGIVASMAADCANEKDLQVLEAEGLFPRSTTWIGFRRNALLRRYMFEFVRLFAPHVSTRQLEDIRRATNQDDIDDLFEQNELPVRGRRIDNIIEAA